ncbi:hypothetical protein ACE3MS_08850 [Paenibacillus dendritiformis]|uniref:hypothetical protein n=1 Tax=Paenibacillus dendritiformis TaxID=130049 RepID=UPI00365FD005
MIIYVLVLEFLLIVAISLFVLKLFRFVQNMRTMNVPFAAELIPDDGLDIGHRLVGHEFQSLNGEVLDLQDNKPKMLVFTMANCSSCNDTYGAVKTFVNINPHISVTMFLKTDTWEEAVALAESKDLPSSVRWVWASDEVRSVFKLSKFPLAFFLSKDHIILNKAIVNNLKQMLTMVNHLPDLKWLKSLTKPA